MTSARSITPSGPVVSVMAEEDTEKLPASFASDVNLEIHPVCDSL